MTNRTATRIEPGVYRVETEEGAQVIYVTGAPGDQWAWWNGRIFRESPAPPDRRLSPSHTGGQESLSAPMPATVLKVLTTTGSQVKRGDTLIVLEAMKMELPLRASSDATVKAVHCREGELVQPDAVLIELS